MKPNETNPKCPICKGPAQKVGFVIIPCGRKQRYRCTICGKSFFAGDLK